LTEWPRLSAAVQTGPLGPSSPLYNGHRLSFLMVERSGRGVDYPRAYLAPRLMTRVEV